MQARAKLSVLAEKGGKKGDLFDALLLKAVDRALVSTIGESGAAVLKFYADLSIIIRRPEKFQESLRKLFKGSEYAPNLLEDKIRRILADLLKEQVQPVIVPIEDWKEKNFKQFILACKRRFEVSNRLS